MNMRPRRVVTPDEAMAIFDQAVREHALVVVTLQDGDEWQTFKSRFLERDPNHRFFVLDYQSTAQDNLPALTPGQYVGISFRYKSRKVMFSTVVEAKGRYVLDDKTTVSAIRYRWPQTLTELQRRAYFRTPIPPGSTVSTKLWDGGAGARSGNQAEVPGELVDLSCGGCLVRLGDSQLPTWGDDATLGIELQLPDGKPPILLNAHFRGIRPDDTGANCAAVQFVGLELSVDGRVVLQRLASNIQKFHRLTSAASLGEKRGAWGF